MLVLFLACAPPDPEFAGDRLADDDRLMAVASTRSISVSVNGNYELDDLDFQLRQIVPGTSSITDYATLASVDADSGRGTLTVPATPSAVDRGRAGSGQPVIYALLLVDEDGVIHGAAQSMLAYYATAPTSRTSAGWLVVTRSSSGSNTYANTTSGMSIRPTLSGEEEFEMAGDNNLGSYSTMRLALAKSEAAGGSDLADVAVEDEYEIEREDWAADASLVNTGGILWAVFEAVVYDDKDGDHDWDRSTDPRLGSACHGSSTVVVRWIEPPTTVDAAYDLIYYGYPWGWSVGYWNGTTWMPISGNSVENLDIKSSCA